MMTHLYFCTCETPKTILPHLIWRNLTMHYCFIGTKMNRVLKEQLYLVTLINYVIYHPCWQVIQVWFQNRRSKEKRDASYRDVAREDISLSTPIATTIPMISAPTPPSLPMSLSASPTNKPTNGDTTA